jgi:hypothetical protein
MADEPDIPQMVQMMRRLYRGQAASMVRHRIEEAQSTHGKAEEAAFWRKVAEALAASEQAGGDSGEAKATGDPKGRGRR